jgi:FtsH-binding integral membrane protein
MACAWAGFAAYGVSMLLSYFIGQRYYRINYPLREMFMYVGIAAVLFIAITLSNDRLPVWAALTLNTLILLAFAAFVAKRDLPLDIIINKITKK